MTHVVIRCDASHGGGIGHLVRAISVAGAARDAGHTVVIAGTIASGLALDLVAVEGIEIVPSPEDLGVLAAEEGASVVHVDNYDISPDALRQVRRSGALMSSVEDGVYGRRPSDIVVDSTVGAEITGRPGDGSGTVLLGIGYAPMRAQVRAARERRLAARHSPRETADVLIVMGGTDAMGAASTMASVCRAAAGVGRITVIAHRRNWDAVRSAAGGDVELVEPSVDFLNRAADADLVVSAAGTTSWELVCIGVPSLLVAVVENQRAGLNAAVAEGVARGLGTLEEVRADPGAATARVAAAVSAIGRGESWAPLGMEKVDGRGADRIVAAWGAALGGRVEATDHPVTSRLASPDDSLMLLRWRNDPMTRAMSRSSSAITLDVHAAWFRSVIDDPSRELYVIERDSFPVGTVRFDERDDDEWEVSITLAPEARGHGLSRPVLAAGQAAFIERHSGAALVASVLPDNAPSMKLFEGAGYVLDPARREGDFEVLVRSIERCAE